jgi:hypothetical protein
MQDSQDKEQVKMKCKQSARQYKKKIPVGAKFSTPVQTCPGAHPASYIMGTGSLSWGYSGRGVALTTHPI